MIYGHMYIGLAVIGIAVLIWVNTLSENEKTPAQ